MATKKATPKGGAAKAAPKKAAPRKAAIDKPAADAAAKAPRKAAAPKAAAPKAAAPKAAAPKAAGAAVKKAAPKKAPAPKLSDAQTNLLKEIAGSGDAGVAASKKTMKTIDALARNKYVKKGKKDGEFFKYHVSKAGEKRLAELDAAGPA